MNALESFEQMMGLEYYLEQCKLVVALFSGSEYFSWGRCATSENDLGFGIG